MQHVKDGIKLINARPAPRPGRIISAVVVFLLGALLLYSLATNPTYEWGFAFQWLFTRTFLSAVAFTIILTVVAMVGGTALAIAMALMRQSINPVLRGVATAYIWFFRGTPVYTQLIFWSLIPVLYPQTVIGLPFLPPVFTAETQVWFTPFWMACVGLSLNEGAYLAEIMRAGILSVDKGQWEAATALGMPRSLIFSRIILPQAMRVIVPPLGNETISMLKTTSLVSAIPFTLELTFIASDRGQDLFKPVPLLIAAAIWYLVITTILMWVQSRIEKYFGRGFERRDNTGTQKDSSSSSAKDGPSSSTQFLDVTP
ncbi:MAG: amino acid ABC transporter permease [Actinomycetaceae bacterium]|nr:amino acid ABC transporter permease [Actinomycetaceae bacterium]